MSHPLKQPLDSQPQPQVIAYSQVIHLSHIINRNIPQWPGDPPIEFDTVAQLELDGYYLRRFTCGEHSATHLNAPKSFSPQGIGIDQYAAASLIAPAVVINIRDQAAINADYTLQVADIERWEQQYNPIPVGSVLLLSTGWQEKWQNPTEFLNADQVGNLHFPGFSPEATQFLLQKRQIKGLGIDTHGVDGGQDHTFAINRLVLAQPRIILENLTNLDQLPPVGTTLVIGILRLQEGSGSPAAVIALVP